MREVSLPSGENGAMHSRVGIASSAALVLTCALTLSACALERGVPTPAPSTGSPSNEASPTATPPASGEALTIACTDLVSDQTIYDWGSGNWALDPGYTFAAGTPAADAVARSGTACGWVNLTSGETMTVSVAALSLDELGKLKSDIASAGSPVTTLGVDAFFASDGGTGTIDVFSGKRWLSASSTWFLEAGDAQPIVSAALEALN